MTAPTTLFRPFTRLVKITILGREFEVPENNPLLRCFQYLAPEGQLTLDWEDEITASACVTRKEEVAA